MKHHQNLTIIGTSHVAGESVELVKKTILELKPTIVALELDRNRLFSLLEKKHEKKNISLRDIKAVGFKGYVFALLGGFFERKMGQKTGYAPGDEQLAGYHIGKEVGAKIALIDQDIAVTLRRFSDKLSWKEKFRFVRDIFGSIFFARKKMKELGISSIDMNKVPDEKVIRKLTQYLKKNYPNVHQVLVEERNIHLARNLTHISQTNPDNQIVAVIGAGHLEEVFEIVKKGARPLPQDKPGKTI